MLGRVDSQNFIPLKRAGISALPARFSGLPEVIAKDTAQTLSKEIGEAGIQNIKLAEGVWKQLSKSRLFKEDLRHWNMSLEDWASRFNVAMAVYLPMAYFSLKNDRHVWETNGRNVLLWFTTLGVARLVKHDKFGVNTILNQFMLPKVEPEPGKALSAVQRLKNKLRPDFNYFEMLETSGIAVKDKSKAAWASLDRNELDLIKVNLANKLTKVAQGDPAQAQAVRKMLQKDAPAFLKRLMTFKFLGAAIQAALTVYIIGILAMEVVFRFIAPLDKDFDSEKYKKATTRFNPAKFKVGTRRPTLNQPFVFSSFQSTLQTSQTPRPSENRQGGLS